MRATSRWYASPIALALVLLVCLAALPSGTSAQAPSITIFGAGTDRCPANGRPVAAGAQGSAFQVSLVNFPAPDVIVTLITPDGRIFNVGSEMPPAGAPFPAPPLPAAAPVAQLPLPPIPHNPVNAMASIQTARAWPTGCYTVTVASGLVPVGSVPPSRAVRATGQFRLLPFGFPAQPANLQLMAQAVGTIQSTATQALIPAAVPVSIYGRATIGALPTLSLIRPDGSIVPVAPAPGSAASGSPGGYFNVAYTLPADSPPGIYTFVATTPAGDIAAATASTRAQFTLAASPSTPSGNAALAMEPFSTLVPQNPFPPTAPATITIAGQGLPLAPPALTGVLVLPNGARIAGSLPAINASGNLPAFAFGLTRHYPTGPYRFEVVRPASGGTPETLLASISWRVNP